MINPVDKSSLARASAITEFQRKPDLEQLEATDKHDTLENFEKEMRMTLVQLCDALFTQQAPYDHVCIARANWQEMNNVPWNIGTFYTRAEFHLWLYAYTLKRTSAIAILVVELKVIAREKFDREKCSFSPLSATDKAFALVIEALVRNVEDLDSFIADFPQRGRRSTVMIDHPKVQNAIHIVRDLPLRFDVTIHGQELVAFFWFTDKGEGAGKVGAGWDTDWVIVNKADADAECALSKYEL